MSNKDLISPSDNLSLQEVKKITKPRKKIIRESNKKTFVKEFEQRSERVEQGVEFRVKDLLDDHWDELSNGLKRSLGSKISEKVKNGKIKNLEVSRRKNNATYYKKKELHEPFTFILKGNGE